MANPGPALPWAAQDPSASREKASVGTRSFTTVTENDLQPVPLEQLGLALGARVEIKWHLETDGELQSRWWGATILGPSTSGKGSEAAAGEAASTSGQTAPDQQHTYQIKYDACGEDFEEEMAEVKLLTEHELWEVQHKEVMWWRKEGDGFEPPDEDDDEEEQDMAEADVEGDEAEGGTVTVGQLLDGISESDAAASEAAMMSRLQELTGDVAHQQRVAAGYRDWMDSLKAFIAAKASAAEGDQVLITAQDIEEFNAMMNTQHKTHAAYRR